MLTFVNVMSRETTYVLSAVTKSKQRRLHMHNHALA